MPIVFRARFKVLRFVLGFGLVMAATLAATGCAKEPAADQRVDKPANAANANNSDQPGAISPHIQPTLKGDIERIALAISMARDAAKQNKAAEAVSQLQFAKKEIDSALSRKPRLSDDFEALKLAIDRAIPTVENREREADARLSELETRIGSIKVNTY